MESELGSAQEENIELRDQIRYKGGAYCSGGIKVRGEVQDIDHWILRPCLVDKNR